MNKQGRRQGSIGGWARRDDQEDEVRIARVCSCPSWDGGATNSQHQHHFREEGDLPIHGVFTSLDGLGIVEFFRHRSVDSVKRRVRTMLAVAASRSFDVLEIRCDVEKTIGAFAEALEQHSMRVLIARPGQHVSVVELMAL